MVNINNALEQRTEVKPPHKVPLTATPLKT